LGTRFNVAPNIRALEQRAVRAISAREAARDRAQALSRGRSNPSELAAANRALANADREVRKALKAVEMARQA
jgi:hypothetical protein